MTQRKQFPLAFCIELNEAVTPYQATKYALAHPGDLLTYRCVICKKQLYLYDQPQGFLNHPLFKRRKRESHEYCLSELYLNHISPSLKYHLEFEETMADIASVAKKLGTLLNHFEGIYAQYWQYTNPQILGTATMGVSLELALSHANKRYKTLEDTLIKIENIYNQSQLEITPRIKDMKTREVEGG